jgi:protein FAM50
MAHYKGAASEAGRAMAIQKKRELEKEEMELRKKKIQDDLKVSQIDNKFTVHYDAIEAQLKANTVGLVTLDQMKAKQQASIQERERQLAQKEQEKVQREQANLMKEKAEQKRQIQTLSFSFGDDADEEEEQDEFVPNRVAVKKELEPDSCNSDSNSSDFQSTTKKLKIMKNPDVDTSFLPDRQRDEEERALREQLRLEWEERQQKLKNEDIGITFSYWDGSGHRKEVVMKKGSSIQQFLQKALEILRVDFPELRVMNADNLMYVKEDLIIPQHYTFYDFIVTKARGKSGPLFSFDVHDDVRLLSDVSVEKDESHAGKVLLRSWYERNKHIFPASRWEPYDPSKTYDKYTIKDTKK